VWSKEKCKSYLQNIISYIGTYLKFDLYRISFYPGISLDRFYCIHYFSGVKYSKLNQYILLQENACSNMHWSTNYVKFFSWNLCTLKIAIYLFRYNIIRIKWWITQLSFNTTINTFSITSTTISKIWYLVVLVQFWIFYSTEIMYAVTCSKRTPLGQWKNGFIRQVTSLKEV
jgi:hypothetical protein